MPVPSQGHYFIQPTISLEMPVPSQGHYESDSTHHFFRNAFSKSGSLRFNPPFLWKCLYQVKVITLIQPIISLEMPVPSQGHYGFQQPAISLEMPIPSQGHYV